MSRNSIDIAPPGYYTSDFGWRYELKKGDLIDCSDEYNKWFRSTVLNTRENSSVNFNGKPIKEVFFGFRYYHEEGHKTDREEGNYTGWVNFDIWRNVSSPLLQRFDSVTKHYNDAREIKM